MLIELDPRLRPTISVAETAVVLNVGVSTVYAAVARGEIPCIRVCERRRIPTASLRRMLGLDAEPSNDAGHVEAAL
jgi:excisionase family DNA binding protein